MFVCQKYAKCFGYLKSMFRKWLFGYRFGKSEMLFGFVMTLRLSVQFHRDMVWHILMTCLPTVNAHPLKFCLAPSPFAPAPNFEWYQQEMGNFCCTKWSEPITFWGSCPPEVVKSMIFWGSWPPEKCLAHWPLRLPPQTPKNWCWRRHWFKGLTNNCSGS